LRNIDTGGLGRLRERRITDPVEEFNHKGHKVGAKDAKINLCELCVFFTL